MKQTDYLIIGGGAAGTTAAETIRKNDDKHGITIISAEPYPLYSRIMLSKPKFLLGQIPIEKTFLKKEDWYKENNIKLIKSKTATKLNSKQKTITLNDNSVIKYNKLLLATGTSARMWDVPGCDLKGICYVKTLEHARQFIKIIPKAKTAVVIGSSFVSFEMCNVLKKAGIKVTVVMLEPYFWYPLLDETAGKMVERKLAENGIAIIREQSITRVEGEKQVKKVILKDGLEIACDLIVCGIGTINNLDWLKSSSLKTNRGILADKFLKTNLPDVWAAGDIAEYEDIILNEQIQMGSWANAQIQGRTAGLNMSGNKLIPYSNVSAFSSLAFGLTVSFVGDVKTTPERKIIIRHPQDNNSYGQIITYNNKILGAVLINRGSELGPISNLIKNQTDISKFTKQLSDPNFNLKKIF